MRNLIALVLALGIAGCAELHYARVDEGTLTGKLELRWIEADTFVFQPVASNPLTFTRSDGSAITPGPMYTDGGSIPRVLWALPGYSPWGYAPAFMVHDWLFDRKHCQDPAYAQFTVDEAAWTMSEVMKTMIEQRGWQPGDSFAVYSMFEAVRSPIAVDRWNHGACVEPPAGARILGAAPRSRLEELLRMPARLEYVVSCTEDGCR